MRVPPSDRRKRSSSKGEPPTKPRYAPRRKRILIEVEEKPVWRSPISPRGHFLSIAILIAIAITAVTVMIERYIAGKATSADPANTQQVAMGRNLYLEHCAYCHGPNRAGQGADATSGIAAPALDQSGRAPTEPDRALFEIVKYGGQPFAPLGAKSKMPGYEFTLADPQIWAILAFLKNRWPDAVRDGQAAINAKAEDEE